MSKISKFERLLAMDWKQAIADLAKRYTGACSASIVQSFQ